jgi:hypothetical protein
VPDSCRGGGGRDRGYQDPEAYNQQHEPPIAPAMAGKALLRRLTAAHRHGEVPGDGEDSRQQEIDGGAGPQLLVVIGPCGKKAGMPMMDYANGDIDWSLKLKLFICFTLRRMPGCRLPARSAIIPVNRSQAA